MNKVFRVIWSEAHGAWVAVSEMTKSHSKRSRKSALALALTAGSLMTISGAAVATGTFVPAGEASVAITSGTCTLDTAADGKNSVSIGCGAGAGAAGGFPGSKAEGDTSIGYQAGGNVKGKENTAIGSNAGENVTGNDNTAFGVTAGKQITGSKNTSLGFNTGFQIKGNGNLSAGAAAGGGVNGDNNVMLGTGAKVTGSAADNRISDTVVIGSAASAAASDNVAIGKGAQAKDANSVALGHASVTSEAVQVTEGIITDEKGLKHTYGGFAGTANGVVSVGLAGAERQIINVAPGAITSTSTDAVNGSQLYGVAKGLNDQVNDLGSSVAGSLGGGSKYEGGKVSADLTVGGKNYTNVQDALNNIGGGWVLGSKAADGTTDQDLTIATGKKVDFNAGKNMEITSEQDADGNVVSTFKTKDDVDFTSVTTGGTVMNDNGLTITNGPSITKTGINAGDLNITNVKAGIADTDGVNVSQLKGVANVIGGVTVDIDGNYTGPTFKVNNTTNTTIAGAIAELDKGWTFTAGGETDQVQAGDKVSLEAGKNMLITSTKDADGNITSTFLTKDAVEFDSVKTGDSLLNNTGLTVGTNVSVTNQGFTAGDVSLTVDGINAGNKKITNVAPGEISDTSLEAINGSQLHKTNTNVANNTTNITKNSGDITILQQGWTLSDGKTGTTQIQAGDTATIKAGDNMDVTIDDVTGEMIVKTQADVNFDSVTLGDITKPDQYTQLTQGGLNIGGNTFVTNGGLTFKGSSVAVSASGINAGGHKITNVAEGVDDSDAVNVGQLKDYVGKNDGSWNISNGTTSSKVATGNTVTIEGGKTGTTAGNINVTHDGNGNLTIESNANVKHDNVTVGETTINKDTGITVGDTNINNQGDITVGDKVSVNKDGVTVGDVSITVDGGINAGDKKITGVADGTIAAGSKDAVNGGQIHDMQVQIDQQAGGWELNDGKGGKQQVKAGDSVAIVGGDNINVEFDADGKMVVETTPDVTHNSVNIESTDANGNIVKGPSMNKDGIDAANKKITSVAKGEVSETSTDAINGSQLDATNKRVTKNEGDIIKNAGDIENIQNGKDGMFQVSQDYNAPKPKPTGKKSAAGGAGAVASGDNSTAVGNDAQATASNSTALGNSAFASANNSVALGQGSVADRENSVSVGTVGGERQITNVAAGVAPTDAVNVSQLDALGSKVNQYFNAANKRIDKVDNNARAGIAAAMAAGTLPQSTLPGKSMVTVGASTYRGESALAIGVSRLSDNARTVIKANASADSRGNAGAAVGAGWHW